MWCTVLRRTVSNNFEQRSFLFCWCKAFPTSHALVRPFRICFALMSACLLVHSYALFASLCITSFSAVLPYTKSPKSRTQPPLCTMKRCSLVLFLPLKVRVKSFPSLNESYSSWIISFTLLYCSNLFLLMPAMGEYTSFNWSALWKSPSWSWFSDGFIPINAAHKNGSVSLVSRPVIPERTLVFFVRKNVRLLIFMPRGRSMKRWFIILINSALVPLSLYPFWENISHTMYGSKRN